MTDANDGIMTSSLPAALGLPNQPESPGQIAQSLPNMSEFSGQNAQSSSAQFSTPPSSSRSMGYSPMLMAISNTVVRPPTGKHPASAIPRPNPAPAPTTPEKMEEPQVATPTLSGRVKTAYRSLLFGDPAKSPNSSPPANNQRELNQIDAYFQTKESYLKDHMETLIPIRNYVKSLQGRAPLKVDLESVNAFAASMISASPMDNMDHIANPSVASMADKTAKRAFAFLLLLSGLNLLGNTCKSLLFFAFYYCALSLCGVFAVSVIHYHTNSTTAAMCFIFTLVGIVIQAASTRGKRYLLTYGLAILTIYASECGMTVSGVFRNTALVEDLHRAGFTVHTAAFMLFSITPCLGRFDSDPCQTKLINAFNVSQRLFPIYRDALLVNTVDYDHSMKLTVTHHGTKLAPYRLSHERKDRSVATTFQNGIDIMSRFFGGMDTFVNPPEVEDLSQQERIMLFYIQIAMQDTHSSIQNRELKEALNGAHRLLTTVRTSASAVSMVFSAEFLSAFGVKKPHEESWKFYSDALSTASDLAAGMIHFYVKHLNYVHASPLPADMTLKICGTIDCAEDPPEVVVVNGVEFKTVRNTRAPPASANGIFSTAPAVLKASLGEKRAPPAQACQCNETKVVTETKVVYAECNETQTMTSCPPRAECDVCQVCEECEVCQAHESPNSGYLPALTYSVVPAMASVFTIIAMRMQMWRTPIPTAVDLAPLPTHDVMGIANLMT